MNNFSLLEALKNQEIGQLIGGDKGNKKSYILHTFLHLRVAIGVINKSLIHLLVANQEFNIWI